MISVILFSLSVAGADLAASGGGDIARTLRPTRGSAASIRGDVFDVVLAQLKEEMDPDFFREHLVYLNLKRVIALAEIEDFDNQSFPLITEAMGSYFRRSLLGKSSTFRRGIMTLESQIEKMDDRNRSHSIEAWRGVFLDAVTAYRRHIVNLPPYWRHLVLGSMTHDSNVNRVSSEDELPAVHSGKGDVQSHFLVRSSYRPFARKDNPNVWTMSFGLSSILHNEFDENDLFDLKFENVFKFEGHVVDRWIVGLTSQWMSAKSLQSASFESSFQRHGLTLGVELDDLFVESLGLAQSVLRLKWTESNKSHFKDINAHRDARESRVYGTWGSRLGGPWGLDLSSSFRNIETDNNPSADHKSWVHRLGLTFHAESALNLKRPMSLSLGASSHIKRYGNYLGGSQEEEWLVWRLGMRTQMKSTLVMLGIEVLEKEDTITTNFLAPIRKDARQVRSTFSLARVF